MIEDEETNEANEWSRLELTGYANLVKAGEAVIKDLKGKTESAGWYGFQGENSFEWDDVVKWLEDNHRVKHVGGGVFQKELGI